MDELLMKGLMLMGVGMGVVFLFLGLLVGVVNAVSILIQKWTTASASSGPRLPDEELKAVFTEAVKRYREDHPKP